MSDASPITPIISYIILEILSDNGEGECIDIIHDKLRLSAFPFHKCLGREFHNSLDQQFEGMGREELHACHEGVLLLEGHFFPGEDIVLIDYARRFLLGFCIGKEVLAGGGKEILEGGGKEVLAGRGTMGTWGRKCLTIFLKFLSMVIEIS